MLEEEEEVQQEEERLLQSSLTLYLPTVTIVDTSVKSLLSCPSPCPCTQAWPCRSGFSSRWILLSLLKIREQSVGLLWILLLPRVLYENPPGLGIDLKIYSFLSSCRALLKSEASVYSWDSLIVPAPSRTSPSLFSIFALWLMHFIFLLSERAKFMMKVEKSDILAP